MLTQNFPPTASPQTERQRRFAQQVSDYIRGERLRALRNDRHESQEHVAYEIGVSVKSVRAWEKGSKIRWENAKSLARYFDVDPETLVSRELDESSAPPLTERLAVSDSVRLERMERQLTEIHQLLLGSDERLVGLAERILRAVDDPPDQALPLEDHLAILRRTRAGNG